MSVKIGSARIDENGKAHGGKAGDQTGKEVSTQAWYKHAKGWRVFRAKSAEAAEKIAKCMEAACKNNKIGYDQYQRNTLYKAAEKVGFDVSKVTTACETDCSALVRVCCAYAGILGLPSDFRTGNMPANLMKTGAFVEMTGSKYTDQDAYLGRGDILVTKTNGHTVVALQNGRKFEGFHEPKVYALGERSLYNGVEGQDVKVLQEYLITLGYDLGKWGADGEYGDCTELAVAAFQKKYGMEETGIVNASVLSAIDAALYAATSPSPEAKKVRIDGGNCYVRMAPNTDGGKLGVAHKGEVYAYGGETSENGWNLIEYKRKGDTSPVNGWVSGKYSRVVAE